MGVIGRKLRTATGKDGKLLMHWCPACRSPHGIRVEGAPPVWSFNGSYDSPSFSPSVLCYTTYTEEHELLPHGARRTLCHYFIKLGIELRDRGANLHPDVSYIDYCGDSPHELRGKIVELPDWPYAPGTYGGIEE